MSSAACWAACSAAHRVPTLSRVEEVNDTQVVCRTNPVNLTAELEVRLLFGKAERILRGSPFHYMADPVLTGATPMESFYG